MSEEERRTLGRRRQRGETQSECHQPPGTKPAKKLVHDVFGPTEANMKETDSRPPRGPAAGHADKAFAGFL